MNQQQTALTPSQVGQYLKGLLDRDRLMSSLLVRGEISNYKLYPSGHHYFTLKDGQGALRCVMFRGDAQYLRFRPENGMQVIAAGRVTVFPRDGQYQLYCTRLTPEGAGDLHLAFEQLKQRLYQQGLFDPAHKQPVPRMPDRIALITSPAGAAVRDMLRILKARWPMAAVFVLPVRVQGEGAAQEIAAAIQWADYYQVADVLLVGRGGGSMEDLWAFNEECVAQAIYHARIPVISAVGHEPDVTISDFAADLRAATPSNGAELAVPDCREVSAALAQMGRRMEQAMQRRIQTGRARLDRWAKARVMSDPKAYFQDKRQLLDYQNSRLLHGWTAADGRLRQRFARLAAALDAMSPLKVLGRGYAIAQTEEGEVLSTVRQARPGQPFTLRLSDGRAACRIESVEMAENEENTDGRKP